MAETSKVPVSPTLTPTDTTAISASAAIGSPVCPPQVTDLVEHLKATGTGQSKLDKITELGKVTKNLEEFLVMLPNNVPPATLEKIDDYLGKVVSGTTDKDKEASPTPSKELKDGWLATEKGKVLLKKSKQAAAKGKGKPGETTTETRDESQSSITEQTILQENKNPVLQRAGDSHSKQLGADVEVPVDGGGDGTDSEEKSEVADLNVSDARDAISRMRSKDKLEHIVLTDKRKSVQDAAEARIKEMESGGE